ncbi:hypothetical protein [Synechococcus sp. PCC 7336]|uniref:hypothetical protein n=1 Tax=Synechococcus sp. PCC 7336 TaxID=195250 RepID=UPI000348AAFC|nr:hypothetical protein [Synechococcus sp. PCC 7336]
MPHLLSQNKAAIASARRRRIHWPSALQIPTHLARFLVVLLAIDSLFLVLHIVHVYEILPIGNRWALGVDRSYSEWFQYGKLFLIASIFLWLEIKYKSRIYGFFSLLFWLIFLDDSLSIHENLGDLIGVWLNTVDHVGEVIAMLALGLVPIISIAISYANTKVTRYKQFSLNLIKLISIYVFSGVVIDFIYSEVYFPSNLVRTILGILEDFGENIAMVLILVFAIRHLLYVRNTDRPNLTSSE